MTTYSLEKVDNMERETRLLLGIFSSLAGLFILGFYSREYWLQRQVAQWSRTVGIVVRAEVSKEFIDGSPSYSPNIQFKYEVKGRAYIGNRVVFGNQDMSLSKAESLVKDYPLNKEVTVYYDPGQPSEAVLSQRYNFHFSNDLPILLFSIVFIGFGVFLLTRFFSSIQKR